MKCVSISPFVHYCRKEKKLLSCDEKACYTTEHQNILDQIKGTQDFRLLPHNFPDWRP